jgi:hypothetical protein
MRRTDPGVVIVTAQGRDVRRLVGPIAWVILEELVALTAFASANGGAVDARLDRLAEELGLSTPRVRAAVGRLAEFGIVEREQPRSPGTHRFASTHYRIVGTTGLVVAPDACMPDDGNPYAGTPHADRRDPVGDGIDLGLPSRARASRTASTPRPRRAASRPAPAISEPTVDATGSMLDRPTAPRRRRGPALPSPQLSLLDPTSPETKDSSRDTRTRRP